jgi:integrase
LTKRARMNGPDVWQFRWWDTDDGGHRVQRSRIIGTVEEYPTEKHAQRAVDVIRLEVNVELPRAVPITVATLIERYSQDAVEMERLAFATKLSYSSFLKNWIRPKWGAHRLEQVHTMAVEQWLRDLQLAPRTKVHIRNVMHVLFECAGRWEFLHNNPITRVRQGGSRRADPDILTPAEFQALLKAITNDRVRTMVTLAGCIGLSRSEFTGLKWGDFDWTDAVLTVQRGVVNNHVGKPKTLARRKPVPLAPELVTALEGWRGKTAYCADSDWVFASELKKGNEPVWPDSLLKKVVQPAAKRAGISKRVGWHSMRHTYSTLLRANGTDIKVQQELLRHSNVQTTMDVYTQAVSEQKRAANAVVVGQLLSVGNETAATI